MTFTEVLYASAGTLKLLWRQDWGTETSTRPPGCDVDSVSVFLDVTHGGVDILGTELVPRPLRDFLPASAWGSPVRRPGEGGRRGTPIDGSHAAGEALA